MWVGRLVTLLAMLWSLAAAEVGALEFTADQITKINGRTQKSNIFYRDNMWRIEHHTMGPVNISIVRKDKKVVWLLLSRMKHFKTVPYQAEQDLKVSERLEGEVSREEIGTETREGHPTTLYEVTVKEGERTEVYYQWLATDIHFSDETGQERRELDCRVPARQIQASDRLSVSVAAQFRAIGRVRSPAGCRRLQSAADVSDDREIKEQHCA